MAFGGLARTGRLGGAKPTAAVILEELKLALGDAFTFDNFSIVGAENTAIARALAAVRDSTEKIINNATPLYCHDMLAVWAERLGVSYTNSDSVNTIRNRCIAKYRAQQGPSRTNIQDTLDALLRNALVEIRYYDYETFEAEDPNVMRCHLTVYVEQPSNMTYDELYYMMVGEFWDLMDLMLPAYSQFDFSIGDEGFIIGESLLGHTAL